MSRSLLPLLLFFSTGCLGPVNSLYPPLSGQPSHDIYIYNNGWHTGVVLNRNDLSPQAQQYLASFSSYPWVEIGWGDDAFYRAPKGTSGLALGAMFCSRGSTLHVVGVKPSPPVFYKRYGVDLYHLHISEAGLRRMEACILGSFATDSAGRVIELEPGLYGFSLFYAAQGQYDLFHTCNHWTAVAIRKTGFPITPAYAQTGGNLAFQLRIFGPHDVVVDLGK